MAEPSALDGTNDTSVGDASRPSNSNDNKIVEFVDNNNHKKEDDGDMKKNEKGDEKAALVRRHPRRSSRKHNKSIVTHHLARFEQLFWKTDDRNTPAAPKPTLENPTVDTGAPVNVRRSARQAAKRQQSAAAAAAAAAANAKKRKIAQKGQKKTNDVIVIGRNLRLTKVSDSPHVYTVDSFLSESELVYLEAFIRKARFQRSFVDAIQQQEDDPNQDEKQSASTTKTTKPLFDTFHRTSTFCQIPKLSNTKIAAIERRASDLLGLSVDQIEPLQLVRYRPGQQFRLHHDLGTLLEDGTVELPPRSKLFHRRRLATIFVYLKTGGGATWFPECPPANEEGEDLRVEPVRGKAVVFCNILKNGTPDPKTVHAGLPDNKEIKYGLNIWACEE